MATHPKSLGVLVELDKGTSSSTSIEGVSSTCVLDRVLDPLTVWVWTKRSADSGAGKLVWRVRLRPRRAGCERSVPW